MKRLDTILKEMNPMSTELMTREDAHVVLTAAQLKDRVKVIQEVRRDVMREDVHYGVIPGTKKESLLQPGAETLCLAFGISVECDPIDERISDEEVFYRVRATAYSAGGRKLGVREAVCSTREKKYRWRRPVHKKEWEAAEEHMRRITFDKDGNEVLQVRQEAGDIAETILGMANKRAHVAVTRMVTGCSDMFGQEGEDEDNGQENPVASPAPATAEAPAPKPADPAGPTPVLITEVKKAATGEKENPDTGETESWTLWVVKTSDKKEYTTFKTTIAVAARKAQNEGKKVQITSSPNKKDPSKSPTIDEIIVVAA